MQKHELSIKIARKTGLERRIVQILLDAFAIEVKDQLLNGNTVHMRGFGTFYIKHCSSRKGWNMGKNKPVDIPAYDKPVFKPAKKLTKTIKDNSRVQQQRKDEEQEYVDPS